MLDFLDLTDAETFKSEFYSAEDALEALDEVFDALEEAQRKAKKSALTNYGSGFAGEKVSWALQDAFDKINKVYIELEDAARERTARK